LARLSQGLEVVDHAIGRYGVGDALDADLSDFLAADLVFDVGEGFVRNQDLPERRLVLQTRGQVHTAADHRIAHAVLATEIPDRAIAVWIPIRHVKGRSMPASRQIAAS